jgi:hypothetical protein
MSLRDLIRDEQGKTSTARVLLIQSVQVALFLAVADSFGWVSVGEGVLDQLTSFVVVFAGWAGGSRLAQHLLPSLSALFSRTRTPKNPGAEG